ncbi:hypothetical protein U1Q18_033337, partial [Sarracenia purpurea var. burkii]
HHIGLLPKLFLNCLARRCEVAWVMRKFRNPLIFGSGSIFLAALPVVVEDGDPLPETPSPETTGKHTFSTEKITRDHCVVLLQCLRSPVEKDHCASFAGNATAGAFCTTVVPHCCACNSNGNLHRTCEPANPEISIGVPRRRSTSGTSSDLPPTEKTLQLWWLIRLLKNWNQQKSKIKNQYAPNQTSTHEIWSAKPLFRLLPPPKSPLQFPINAHRSPLTLLARRLLSYGFTENQIWFLPPPETSVCRGPLFFLFILFRNSSSTN